MEDSHLKEYHLEVFQLVVCSLEVCHLEVSHLKEYSLKVCQIVIHLQKACCLDTSCLEACYLGMYHLVVLLSSAGFIFLDKHLEVSYYRNLDVSLFVHVMAISNLIKVLLLSFVLVDDSCWRLAVLLANCLVVAIHLCLDIL